LERENRPPFLIKSIRHAVSRPTIFCGGGTVFFSFFFLLPKKTQK